MLFQESNQREHGVMKQSHCSHSEADHFFFVVIKNMQCIFYPFIVAFIDL